VSLRSIQPCSPPPMWFLLQVNEDSLLHLFELRQALEVRAARLAATRITEEELAALAEIVWSAENIIDVPGDLLDLDFKIHASVIRALRNALYMSMVNGVSQLLLESRQGTPRSDMTRGAAHRSHVEIRVALGVHDAEASDDAIERRLWGSIGRLALLAASLGMGRPENGPSHEAAASLRIVHRDRSWASGLRRHR